MKFFVYPFAVSGDQSAVPDPAQVGGSVSYQNGFTINYQLPLGSNPSALPINRLNFNSILNDITTALQWYQSYGAWPWITSVENDGTPYPYAQNAICSHAGQNWISNVNSNTSEPGTDSNWTQTSGGLLNVPSGAIIPFAGLTIPAGYLLADGSAVSRATYANLMNATTFQQSGVLASSTTITGLTSTAGMYGAYTNSGGSQLGMPIEGTGIPPNTTIATIVNSTTITITNAATLSGTETLTFFNWGNGNGSTTFNLPDFTRYGMVGSGGTGTNILQNVLGQFGGMETSNQVPSHIHSGTSNISGDVAGGSPTGITFGANDQSSSLNVQLSTATNPGASHIDLWTNSNIVTMIVKT